MVVEDDDTNTCSHGCIHICSVDTHRHTHTYTNTQIFYIYWLREQSDSKFGLSSINHSLVLLLLLFFSLLYFFFHFAPFFPSAYVLAALCIHKYFAHFFTYPRSFTHMYILVWKLRLCKREKKKLHAHTRTFFFCWSSLLFYFIENNQRHEKKVICSFICLTNWTPTHKHIHNIIFELNALKLHHKCIFCSPFIFFFHHQ